MGETLITELMEDAPDRDGDRARARRLAVAEFRPRRTAIGLVTALVVTSAAGIVAYETLAFMLGRPFRLLPAEDVARLSRRLTWRDAGVLATGAGLAGTGLLLLLAALPGRARLVALRGTGGRSAAGVARSALQRSLTAAALGVPGVGKAKVRLRGRLRRRRRVVVWASTRYRNPANLSDLVRTAVTAHLESVGLMDERRVDVRLSWRKD
ncbi:DUF6286 domain-containing protein [Spirillospora sp. NPDC047279]|uniref:DUF6286 domain-containing protein n=1 Tax=Spirillospora sp. NPDC047279 TaxID=3155478 RepID=UPI0034035162